MAVQIIDVSINNPSLALLRARKYDKAYTALPNTKLSAELRDGLNVIYNALAGSDMPIESNTFLIKAQDGYLQRLFSPVVGYIVNEQGEKQLATRWGNEMITLNVDSDAYTLKAGQFDFSGRGQDACIFVNVKVGKDVVRMPFSIRQANWDNKISVDDLDYMLCDDVEQLLGALGELKEGGTAGSGGNEIISLRDLEVDQTYNVVAYKEIKTPYGLNFIVTFDDGVQCWGHKSINPVLAAKPTIDVNNPAELIVLEKREYQPGKFAIKACLFVSADDDDQLVF